MPANSLSSLQAYSGQWASKEKGQSMETVKASPVQKEQVVWEDVPCPLCGSEESIPELSVPLSDYEKPCTLVRCSSCSMVYLNPRPTAETIGYFYPEDYVAYRSPSPELNLWQRFRRYLEWSILSEDYGYELVKPGWLRTVLSTLARPFSSPEPASHTSIPYYGEGNYLDVGCGGGWLAHRMQERGWTVTGIDFSQHSVEQVRANYDFPVHLGSLPHPEIKPESFDVVNLAAVLEHVHQPHEFIQSAVDVLKPGGQLVLSVPNYDSWDRRYFGPDWYGLSIPHHTLHFTPNTLTQLIEAHGLTVKDLRIVGHASWIRHSLKQRLERSELTWSRRLFTRIQQLRVIPRMMTRHGIKRNQGNCLFLIAQRSESKGKIESLRGWRNTRNRKKRAS